MVLLRATIALVFAVAAVLAQQPPIQKPSPAPASATNSASTPSTKPTKPQPEKKPDPNDPSLIWYERAQRLTTDLLEEDRWRLHMLGEALPARLAEAWWKVDQPRARQWLTESVYAVTFGYQNDKPEVLEERLEAAAIVFDVANKYDPAGARKIESMMMAMAEQDLAAGNRRTAGTVQNALTRSLRMDDNDSAGVSSAEIGEDLLRLGDQNLQMSLGRIARKDPAGANRVFSDAITKAMSGGNNYHMFFGLAEYAWPALSGGSFAPPLPDTSQAQLLDALAGTLLRPPQSDKDREQVCRSVAPIANRLLDKFPTAQAGMVQTAITNCNAQAGSDKQHADCSSVDDCLKAADLETDPGQRAELKMQAAFMASNDQDAIRALDLFDSLTTEEREAAPDWSYQRSHLVAQALEELYKKHDTVRIQRLLDDTPEQDRADTLLSFGYMVTRAGDAPYGQLMFSQARAVLEKSPVQNPHVYTMLLSAYAQYLPEQSLPVFTLVVNGLNQIKYADPKDLKDEKNNKKRDSIYFVPLGSRLEPAMVPGSLLDKDDAYVFASIKGLDDPRARASFRLAYLQVALKKYQELKNAKPKAPDVKVASESKPAKR